jgi:hypothetical protein
MKKEKEIDKLELYSFGIYLYMYSYFVLATLNNNWINFIIYNIVCNGLLNYMINHNIVKLITHKYFNERLNDVSMPQLLTCMSNIYINSKMSIFGNNTYIKLPVNILLNSMITKLYKNEIKESFHLRFILSLFCFMCSFFFIRH